MQRKLYKKEERGLKGGPNYQVSEMMGSVTSTGYWPDSPDRNNDFNIIPSNEITMEGMDIPLMGMDNLGNTQYMTPGNNYTFPGSYVTETPIAKKGGMFLGHYTFKDGGLVRMDPGGPTKKQAAADKANNQQQAKAWDANQLNGAQEEMLNYDPKTGEYKNWKGEVVRVETKPMTIGSPKSAPKKTKEQIEKEKAEKYSKKTQADPTLWLQEHPEFMLDENGAPVLRSSMQENAPADYLAAEQKNLKEEFIKEQNTDPLQQSLGAVTDENPQTKIAAERYANTELATPLLEKNPRDKYATRAEWIESFTPQERAIIQGSNKAYEFDPALSTQFARALQTEGNKNESWQRNLDLTEEEKNRPVTKMDRLGLFAPLAYPVNVMTGAMTGDFGDAAKGYTPKPLFGDDNTMRDYYQHDAQTMGNALFQAGIDPLNYIGAGLLQDAGASTNIFKGLQKLPDGTVSNLNRGAKPLTAENNLSNALQGTGSLFSQVKGELLQGSRNRKAIAEGNEWLSNWINHPTTQGKIDADMGNEIDQFVKYYAGDDLDKQIEVLNLMKNQSKNFKPNSKEYPLFRQIIDNIDQYYGQKIEPIHDGNWGVSYQHGTHPIHRQVFELGTKTPHDRYGSWISRTVDLPQAKRSSTAVHEGTHDWVSDLAFTHSGMRNKVFANMNPTIKADYIQWKNLRNQGIDPETVMGKQRAYMAYLGNPTEQHARIMELRKGLGLKPNEVVTPDYAKEIGYWIDSGGSGIDPRFLDVVDRDPKKLANLFNELWVAVPAVGVGAAALQQEKKGGGIYLGAYKQVGGQLVPHDISVPNLSKQNGGGIDYEAIKDPELAAKARAMGHNTIAEYRDSNWGYGKNMKQPASANTAPIAGVTGPPSYILPTLEIKGTKSTPNRLPYKNVDTSNSEPVPEFLEPGFQDELSYLEAKNKLRLRQELEGAQARFEGGEDIFSAIEDRDKAENSLNEMYKKYPNDERLRAKEEIPSKAVAKWILQQAAEKYAFKGLNKVGNFIPASWARFITPQQYQKYLQSAQGANNIESFFDLQDIYNAVEEGKNKYAYYTEELQKKVDDYEKAHGTYQPGLMDKIQALMPNKQDGGPAYDIPAQAYRDPKISRDIEYDDREYYDPMTEVIHMRKSYPNVLHEAFVKDHENVHHMQKLKGKLSSTENWPGPLKEPVLPMSDDMIFDYYNRAAIDVNNLVNAVPQSTLIGIPNDVIGEGFQLKTYDTPGTAEYEANHFERPPRTLRMYNPIVEQTVDKALGRERQDPEMMFRDKYNTELTKEEQKDFDKWVAKESKQQGRDIMMDKGAYDIQGFWKSGDWKNRDADNHGTDTWKKPNHPTFSNQSKYHGEGGWYGGNWTEDAGYQPSKQTLNNYGLDYYNWLFNNEPNRPEHLDMNRYDGENMGAPVIYQKGGSVKKVKIKSLPKNWKSQ